MVADERSLGDLCARIRAGRGPAEVREAIARGADPLGDAFCELRSPRVRRSQGATYTPPALVDAMVAWAAGRCAPVRVVDPGCGSGRFLRAAARAFPGAELVGVDNDPLAVACARASLVADGLADRSRVVEADYRAVDLGPAKGPTLFLGNPPYVRHHDLAPRWKAWLRSTAGARGLPVSALAGLHVHFMLATADHAAAGDVGCLITAAEWLDVNYGALPRALLAETLGLERLVLLAPESLPFADAQTTAAIACFAVGSRRRSVRFESATDAAAVAGGGRGRSVARRELAGHARWTPLTRPRRLTPKGTPVGELFRVHRGQVTGANRVWIEPADGPPVPEAYLAPCITRARELIAAAPVLESCRGLRRVIALPADLDDIADAGDRARVDRFLAWARDRGAHAGYIARHRTPWWAVKLRPAAPILMTYMARRPPVFVLNRGGARHINIAHGLYPRDDMTSSTLADVVARLNRSVDRAAGRTYAGGLTKFEPREVERVILAA